MTEREMHIAAAAAVSGAVAGALITYIYDRQLWLQWPLPNVQVH